MQEKNYDRMMELIDDVFATRDDPDQLQVNNKQMEKLGMLHRSTLTEVSNQEGPLIWCLIFPTTAQLMEQFLAGRIGETQLLENTAPQDSFDCIYLCSVTALPEARGKGLARSLCLQAIQDIRRDHPISTLFVWPFSKEGKALSESLAKKTGLKLRYRVD